MVAIATFAAASPVLIVLPGPDNALVVRHALRYGRFVGLRHRGWLAVFMIGFPVRLVTERR